MPKAKRAFEVDLMGEDESKAKPRKLTEPNNGAATSSRSPSNPPLLTPPTSSQPNSSQGQRGICIPRYDNPGPSQVIRDGLSDYSSEIEEEVHREIDLTNDFDDDVYENYELYGIFNTKVVGIRYYDGRATTGEYVKVRREPRNPYDSNAIRIDNVMGDQIGHIGRQVAAKLAGLMDSKQLLVEGALTGPKGAFDAPIALKLFGTSDPVAATALKERMQDLRLPVNELVRAERERQKRAKAMEQQRKARERAAAAMREGGGVVFDQEGPNRYANFGLPSNIDGTARVEELLYGTVSFNPRDVQKAVNTLGLSEDALSKIGMAEQPSAIVTPLLPYQRQGLRWMRDQESPQLPRRGSDDIVQLWRNINGAYMNIATSFAVDRPPELAKGGVLADDMGLGKTLQVLALIVADQILTSPCPTLIIAPLSVMSNWSTQAQKHIRKKHALKILTYHGQDKRGMSAEELLSYDIVITTYQTMALELFPFGKDKPQQIPASNGLFSIHWRRVVLDEGHNIRNPKAKMSQAACALRADSRWVLTGTPIVNSLRDLYALVKFLRMTGGLGEFEIFNGTLIRPLKNGDDGARMLLQALMSSISLRRTKDMKFVDLKLPKLEFHKYIVRFLPHERERYEAFKSEAKGLLEAAKTKQGEKAMTHLLEVLLRLRQTCNHWKMCGEERVGKLLRLVGESKAVDIMNPENRQALQDLLQIRMDSQEDCPICIDLFRQPVITACAHTFCTGCIEKVIETQKKCPMCRAELVDRGSLIQPLANLGERDAELGAEMDMETSSSKIEALVKLLKASQKDGNTTVVFSQWTSFLDLVQRQLVKHGLVFTRLDGKMNAAQRDAAMESLSTDPDCRILLASLGVCSVGLNLVAANQVILSDSWWAPAIEDQAVDRVHRLGQTRDCKVVRLVMEDSIEDEVLEIQTKKRKLAGMAFGEKDGRRGRAEEQAQRLRDIERLLG